MAFHPRNRVSMPKAQKKLLHRDPTLIEFCSTLRGRGVLVSEGQAQHATHRGYWLPYAAFATRSIARTRGRHHAGARKEPPVVGPLGHDGSRDRSQRKGNDVGPRPSTTGAIGDGACRSAVARPR